MKKTKIIFIVIFVVILLSHNIMAAGMSNDMADEFSRAEAMATWFTLFMSDYDAVPRLIYGDKTIYLKAGVITEEDDEDEGLPFALVENYKNIDELKNDLKTVFSDEIVDRLLNARYKMSDGYSYPHFVEYNGALYFKNWAYASNLNTRPEMKLEMIESKEKKTVLQAEFKDAHGDNQTYEYVYELMGDKWVFTKFELPKYLYYKDIVNDDFASPLTSDTPVIAVCALAISAAAAVVVLKKKRI